MNWKEYAIARRYAKVIASDDPDEEELHVLEPIVKRYAEALQTREGRGMQNEPASVRSAAVQTVADAALDNGEEAKC